MRTSAAPARAMLVVASLVVLASCINVPPPDIITIAGDGSRTYGGDTADATTTGIDPAGLAVDASGTLHVADFANNAIRQLEANGTFVTMAGSGARESTGDGGPAKAAGIAGPRGIAFDDSGALLIAEFTANRVRRLAPDGTITTVAGTGIPASSGDGGPANAAGLAGPQDVAAGPAGELYISELNGHRIRRVAPDGVITTVAGTGEPGFAGDGGNATDAKLNAPAGLAIGPDGSIYIADSGNHRVRVLSADGLIRTVAGQDKFRRGTDVRIGGYGGDRKSPSKSTLDTPFDVAVDGDGNVYIADSENHRVRRIDIEDDRIETVVGNGESGTDDGPGDPRRAELDFPRSLTITTDREGDLMIYIADGNSFRVRRAEL